MAKTKAKSELKTPGITDEAGSDGSSQSLDAPVTLGSAPTPAAAEKAAEAKKPEAKKAPAKPKPSVPLRVFAAVSGMKPDQFQAFARYAQLEEMRPCPVVEWKTRFEAFKNRPVKAAKRKRSTR